MAKKPGGLGRGLGSLFGDMDVDLSVLDPAEISVEPAAPAKADTTLSEFFVPWDCISTTSSARPTTSGSSPKRSLPSTSAQG